MESVLKKEYGDKYIKTPIYKNIIGNTAIRRIEVGFPLYLTATGQTSEGFRIALPNFPSVNISDVLFLSRLNQGNYDSGSSIEFQNMSRIFGLVRIIGFKLTYQSVLQPGNALLISAPPIKLKISTQSSTSFNQIYYDDNAKQVNLLDIKPQSVYINVDDIGLCGANRQYTSWMNPSQIVSLYWQCSLGYQQNTNNVAELGQAVFLIAAAILYQHSVQIGIVTIDTFMEFGQPIVTGA